MSVPMTMFCLTDYSRERLKNKGEVKMKCGECDNETSIRCPCGQSICEEHVCVIESGDVRMAVCVDCYEKAKSDTESEIKEKEE